MAMAQPAAEAAAGQDQRAGRFLSKELERRELELFVAVDLHGPGVEAI
jgi:hypothetical protein